MGVLQLHVSWQVVQCTWRVVAVTKLLAFVAFHLACCNLVTAFSLLQEQPLCLKHLHVYLF